MSKKNKNKGYKTPAKKRNENSVSSFDEIKISETEGIVTKSESELENERRNTPKESKEYLFGKSKDLDFLEHKSNISQDEEAYSPYNFIPLNSIVVSCEKPKDNNKYYTNLHSGYITLDIESKTPIFIRDSLTLAESIRKDNGERNVNSNFYTPNGSPRIPGSSLRGMVQTLVEIVSYSRFKYFDGEKKFHFRAFADKSLDLRDKYSNLMIEEKEEDGKSLGYTQQISAGYLVKEKNEFKIIPAKVINGLQFFRVEEDLVIQKKVLNEKMSVGSQYYDKKQSRKIEKFNDNIAYRKGFKNVKFIYEMPKSHEHSNNKRLYYQKVIDIVNENQNLANSIIGALIFTGWMRGPKFKPRGKHLHWVIGPEETGKRIEFAKGVIQNYKDDVNKSEDSDLLKYFKNGQNPKVPCFYIEEGNEVISFGYTGLFRLAYKYAVKDFLNNSNKNFDEIDIATAVFGNTTAFSSRVFFEDSKLVSENSDVFLTENNNKILSSPKPTSFQLYLTQDKFDKSYNNRNQFNGYRGLKDYNDKGMTILRGNKLYWHQTSNENSWIANPNDVKNHPTQYVEKIKPIKPNTTFKGRIRFENLSEVELGALLFVLDLPEDLAHKIGMGKPLGLGSIKIKPTLHISDRLKRYTDLFAEWNGIEKSDKSEVDRLKKIFEKYILENIGENKNTLWDVDRIKELKVMLDFKNKPDSNKIAYMDMNNKPNQFAERKVLPKPSEVGQ